MSGAGGDVGVVGGGVVGPETGGLLLSDLVVGLLEVHGGLALETVEDVAGGAAAELGGEGVVVLGVEAGVVLVLEGQVGRGGDGVVEEEGAEGTADGKALVHDGGGTSGLARDGYAGRVTAELADEDLDPGESKGLIEETGVDDTLAADLGGSEETESTKLERRENTVLVNKIPSPSVCRFSPLMGRGQESRPQGRSSSSTYTILDGDDDEALVVGVDDLSHVLAAIAEAVATAVDPDEDGQVLGVGGGVDVEEEAVLVTGDEGHAGAGGQGLGASRAEGVGLLDGGSEVQRGHQRRLPAEVPGGGEGIADAKRRVKKSPRAAHALVSHFCFR